MLAMLNRHLLGKSLNRIQSNSARLILTSQSNSTSTKSNSDSEDDNVLKENPYYGVYANKLRKLKEENLTAYKEKMGKLKSMKKPPPVNKLSKEVNNQITEEQTSEIEIKAKPARRLSQTYLVKQKKLEDVMNVELLQGKNAEEISEIWIQYHKEKKDTPVVSAAVPYNNYKLLYDKSIQYPMFVLPLPRGDQGYEFMFVQFQHNVDVINCTAHLTPLIAYQKHKENAPECMSIEYYSDLIRENGADNSTVLMRSFYDYKLLSPIEATCLVNQLRIFYENKNTRHETLLKLFNEGHSEFHYSDVIACVETLSI